MSDLGTTSDLGFQPEAASDDLGFTPESSGMAIASNSGRNLPPVTAPNWTALFSGVDGLENQLDPQQSAIFGALDGNTPNPKEARAQAINQAYVLTRIGDVDREAVIRNWPAIRKGYAKMVFGMEGEVTDATLYGAIGKRLQEDADVEQFGEIKAWTWQDAMGSDWYRFNQSRKKFWESINVPLVKLPDPPDDLPNMPLAGFQNPALVAGVYKGIKPLIEGVESPFGIATIGFGTALKALSSTYPLAKVALAGMGGLFSGLMAKATVEGAEAAPDILRDPNVSVQDKIAAVSGPVATGAAALLGAVGVAFEFIPKERVQLVTKAMEGKSPAEAAEVLRNEARMAELSDQPQATPVIAEAAARLEELAPEVVDSGAHSRTQALAAETPLESANSSTGFTAPRHIARQGDPVGIKNANVDAELAAMGEKPATHGEKLTFEGVREEIQGRLKEDPFIGQKLVNNLRETPRPISAREDVLLTFEMNRRRLARDAAEKDLIDAVRNGDRDGEVAAQFEIKKARHEFEEAAAVATQSGTANAQALAFRRLMMKEDYSLAALERRASVAKGGQKLTEPEMTELREIHQRLTAAEKTLADYRAAQAAQNPAAPTQGPVPVIRANAVRKYLATQADAARARIMERMKSGRVQSGLDPLDLADHAIIGADYLAKGVGKFSDWSTAMVKELGEAIRPHLNEIFVRATAARAEAIRLSAFKKRRSGQIEELKDRLETGDYTQKEKPKPIHLDEEANRLQAEYDLVKMEVDSAIERARYESKSVLGKAKEQALNVYDTARLLMTTGEFSFILRQGKALVLSHPITAAKALPNTFKAMFTDPAGARALNLEVLNHPDAPAARAAKLHLLEEGAKLTKQEELLAAKWAGKIPVVGRFNQAATVFLNRLRFDVWKQMRESVKGDALAEKQLAMFVNEATGRGGLGSLEQAAVPLGRLMFAPRYFASRLQMVAGHSLWGGTMQTRAIIAKEYAKTLISLGLYYTMLETALDSDEKPAEIGIDPRSSDFGKVKIGNTRLDPLAGVAQVVTFAARTITGETTNAKGVTKSIRGENVPFGGDKWSDVAARFGRSKLHPVPASIANLFDGTDLAGNPADIGNQALNMAAPITYQDIYVALQEHDLPEGVALGLLAMLGEGLQTYGTQHPGDRKSRQKEQDGLWTKISEAIEAAKPKPAPPAPPPPPPKKAASVRA